LLNLTPGFRGGPLDILGGRWKIQKKCMQGVELEKKFLQALGLGEIILILIANMAHFEIFITLQYS
jgi:hypothetical protein